MITEMKAKCKHQENHNPALHKGYCVRNDSPCASTIRPILSARLGLLTVDIGSPQLSMHFMRKMCCSSIIYQET
ncbi:aspartyl aminopeptidase-like [Acropora palmata]|uniref:aspartyl aminopeptidase-like n=1 Tax=Acropora palmata TaxID=6131 RepID=UPI003DA16251